MSAFSLGYAKFDTRVWFILRLSSILSLFLPFPSFPPPFLFVFVFVLFGAALPLSPIRSDRAEETRRTPDNRTIQKHQQTHSEKVVFTIMSAPSSSSPTTNGDAPSTYTESDIRRHREDWFIPSSLASSRTLNPIRAIVDRLVVPTGTDKKLLPLSIGDPTVFGNLQPPESAIQELTRIIQSGKANGYAPSTGTKEARSAIARRYTSSSPFGELAPDDIMICSGASGALQIAMDACLNAGDNILLPRPGFSLYATIAGYLNVEVRYYDLLPDHNWECDLQQARSLVDERTRAILINNPSNPNGSNFKRTHLEQIVAFAEEMKLLIISDEIYADMVFEGHEFVPIADLSKEVPVIACGGIAKQYVVPGWRIGWLLFHDRAGRLRTVRDAAIRLTQIILGANTIVQALLPSMLLDTPKEYYVALNHTLEVQSLFLYNEINRIPGLQAIEPQACMYLMVRIDVEKFPNFSDDVEFSKGLLQEQMLFVLPGSCFLADNFIRLVTCAPKHILEDAIARLRKFAEAHYKP